MIVHMRDTNKLDHVRQYGHRDCQDFPLAITFVAHAGIGGWVM